MDSEGSAFNPYQAPSEPPTEPALAPDTEFLFNDKFIAGIGTIVLPQVCVVTGARNNLMARQSRLWWCSRWISVPRNLAILVALLFGIPIGMEASTRRGVAGVNWMLAVAAIIVASPVVLYVAGLVFRRSVDVHWFISTNVDQRHRVYCFVSLMVIVAVAAAIWAVGGVAIFGLIISFGFFGTAAMVAMVRGKQVLSVAGIMDGLFLISGVSDKFLKEISRMASEHAKQKQT